MLSAIGIDSVPYSSGEFGLNRYPRLKTRPVIPVTRPPTPAA